MKEIRELSESERNWAMLCHLSAFAGFFFPFGGIIGPLICWLSRKDESQWVDQNGKAVSEFPDLNFIIYGSGSSFMFHFSGYSDSDIPGLSESHLHHNRKCKSFKGRGIQISGNYSLHTVIFSFGNFLVR